MRLAITTSGKESPELEAEARAAALAASLPFLRRRPGTGLEPLLKEAEALIVFEVNGISLVDQPGGKEALRFAAGLAHLRIKQLRAGTAGDRLVDVAQLRPGERVLDCTLGLAADAQVAAWAVGTKGQVTGLESAPPLALLTRHGLQRLYRQSPAMKWAAHIEVIQMKAERYLSDRPKGSFEVVLLDPMFGHPRKASPAFELLRRHADHAPLTARTLAEARRVARRLVVVKGAGGSGDLERLGLSPLPGRRGARVEWAIATPL